MTEPAASSLAERKRRFVRDELTESAVGLLATQGFEQTTVEQIVAVAGVSRRTFFRYFRSKEDVIVEFLGDIGANLRAILAARPADEPPTRALRETVLRISGTYEFTAGKALRMAGIILSTPALLARFLERQSQWRGGLAEVLAGRMGVSMESDLRPLLIVNVAFAAFDAALASWVTAGGDTSLELLTVEALGHIEGLEFG